MIKEKDLKAQNSKKFDKKGGISKLRQDFKTANTLSQLKRVLADIFISQGFFEEGD